jgi:hypothetical protein
MVGTKPSIHQSKSSFRAIPLRYVTPCRPPHRQRYHPENPRPTNRTSRLFRPGVRRNDCIRISGCCTLPIIMDSESSRYQRRNNCEVTVRRNLSPRFDRRTLAEEKVGARVRLPEQVLWIKEGYEYH